MGLDKTQISTSANGLGVTEPMVWYCYEFSIDVELTSVDADYLGHVYVSDAPSGTIYKFDGWLNPIASYGGLGLGDGDLFYPEGIEFVQQG